MCVRRNTLRLNRYREVVSNSINVLSHRQRTELSRYNFFLLQMEGVQRTIPPPPPPRLVITPRKLEILYFPSLPFPPISTFLVRNSFIARPSGERLALVLYVVPCVLIKNFRLSELPSPLPSSTFVPFLSASFRRYLSNCEEATFINR